MAIGGIGGGGIAIGTHTPPAASSAAKSTPSAASPSASAANTTSITPNANGLTTTTVTDAQDNVVSSSATPPAPASRTAPGATLNIQA